MKNKHADLIHAWADGAEIQFREYAGEWNDFQPNGYACWHQDMEYRIKPEPKPDFRKYFAYHFDRPCIYPHSKNEIANLALIFDGETGELKNAEVI